MRIGMSPQAANTRVGGQKRRSRGLVWSTCSSPTPAHDYTHLSLCLSIASASKSVNATFSSGPCLTALPSFILHGEEGPARGLAARSHNIHLALFTSFTHECSDQAEVPRTSPLKGAVSRIRAISYPTPRPPFAQAHQFTMPDIPEVTPPPGKLSRPTATSAPTAPPSRPRGGWSGAHAPS